MTEFCGGQINGEALIARFREAASNGIGKRALERISESLMWQAHDATDRGELALAEQLNDASLELWLVSQR